MKKILVIAEKEMADSHIEPGIDAAGFEMHVVRSAEDAIGSLKEISPVLCIIDRSVSGYDGSELFKKIRSQSEIPVLALSDGDSQYSAMILNEGADDCLAKKFSPDELAARIHAVMKRWRKLRVYDRISIAFGICRSLSAWTPSGIALDNVFSMLEKSFEFQSCVIFLNENGTLTPVKYVSPCAESIEIMELLQVGEEVINQALRDLRPVLTVDCETGSAMRLFKDERSMMCAPLACDLGLFGAIYVGAEEAGVYDEMDLEVLSAIGCLARLALEGAKCNEAARQFVQSANSRIDDLRHESELISALDELTRALNNCPSEEDIIDAVGARIKNLLNYRSFIVFLTRKNDNEMEVFPGFIDSPCKEILEDKVVKITDNALGWVIAQRKPLFLEDTQKCSLSNVLENERSSVICPMVVENEVLGVVYAGSEEPLSFDVDMIEKVSSISDRITVALANVRS